MEDQEIEVTHFTFPSAGDGAPVHAMTWIDQAFCGENAPKPRGIVQLVHGMCEYIERYDQMARYLAARGFVVCGQDRIGHGKTAPSPEAWGCLPAKTGKTIILENTHKLRTLMTERFGAQVPYFMYGHSMGSFVVRCYLARHGADLAGAIICGTGDTPGAVANGGKALAGAIVKSKGENYVSSTLFNMADGAYGKAVPNARTPFDWLSTDPVEVDKYIADPACGFPFSAGGYYVLMGLLSELGSAKSIAKLPKDLPLYLIAGSDDPVGNRGRDVVKLFQKYKKAGISDVNMRLYVGMRHEIHNEPDREKVFAEMVKWLEGHLA